MLFSFTPAGAVTILGICMSVTASPFKRANEPDVHCGVGGDAVFSKCQELLSPEVWENSLYNHDETYSAGGGLANKVACINGCCVFSTAGSGKYVDDNGELIRKQALSLLGCEGEGKKTGIPSVSALGNFGGQSICVAGVEGGNRCFSSKHFKPKKGSWDYPFKATWDPKKGAASSEAAESQSPAAAVTVYVSAPPENNKASLTASATASASGNEDE